MLNSYIGQHNRKNSRGTKRSLHQENGNNITNDRCADEIITEKDRIIKELE